MEGKWFVVVDRDGHACGPSCLVPMELTRANELQAVVTAAYARTLNFFSLFVYANRGVFEGKRTFLSSNASIRLLGTSNDTALIVVAKLGKTSRAPPTAPWPVVTPDVLWFGLTWEKDDDLLDTKLESDNATLRRRELTDHVIARLHEHQILQIEAPRTTGKTALAALVCRSLQTHARAEMRRAAIACISAVRRGRVTGPTFRDAFERQCGVTWEHFQGLAERGYKLYVVHDDVHAVNLTGPSYTTHDYSELWRLVDTLLETPGGPIHILLLSRHGSRISDVLRSPPVRIPLECMLYGDKLNFKRDEIRELVRKAFWWVDSLDAEADMTRFCELLQSATGGHVSLCVTAICLLNAQETDHPRLQAEDWINMMQVGCPQEVIFAKYVLARCYMHCYVPLEETALKIRLKRLLLTRGDTDDDVEDTLNLVDQCVVRGIVAYRSNGQLAFASVMHWRDFAKQCMEGVERAREINAPKTFTELMERCLRVFETNDVQGEKRFRVGGVFRERSLELTFYMAVQRETPQSFEVSLGVGMLKGSSASEQLTVRAGEQLWRIVVVQDSDHILGDVDHVDDRDRGGHDSRLALMDVCRLVFRESGSPGDAALSAVTRDAVVKLFNVYYDTPTPPLMSP